MVSEQCLPIDVFLGGSQRRWMEFVLTGMEKHFGQDKELKLKHQKNSQTDFQVKFHLMENYGWEEEHLDTSWLHLIQLRKRKNWKSGTIFNIVYLMFHLRVQNHTKRGLNF